MYEQYEDFDPSQWPEINTPPRAPRLLEYPPQLGHEIALYRTDGMTRDEWLQARRALRSVGAPAPSAPASPAAPTYRVVQPPDQMWMDQLAASEVEHYVALTACNVASERYGYEICDADTQVTRPESGLVGEWSVRVRQGVVDERVGLRVEIDEAAAACESDLDRADMQCIIDTLRRQLARTDAATESAICKAFAAGADWMRERVINRLPGGWDAEEAADAYAATLAGPTGPASPGGSS